MPEAYEDRVGRELDDLFQGALFLTAGDGADAERLLVETVANAFGEWTPEGSDSARWLEGRLARRFFGGTLAPAPIAVDLADIGPVPSLDSTDFFRAAGSVPAWARAGLWLVLLKRWSYADASVALGVRAEVLRRMLDYRHVLVREMLRSGPGTGSLTQTEA